MILSKCGLSTAPHIGDVEAAWLHAQHSVQNRPGDYPRLRYVALNLWAMQPRTYWKLLGERQPRVLWLDHSEKLDTETEKERRQVRTCSRPVTLWGTGWHPSGPQRQCRTHHNHPTMEGVVRKLDFDPPVAPFPLAEGSSVSINVQALAASWCTGSCNKGQQVRGRGAGTGTGSLVCRGHGVGGRQGLCLHHGPPDNWEPGPWMERKDPS